MQDKRKIVFISLWIFLITLIGLILWNQYQQKKDSQQNQNYQNWLKKPKIKGNQYEFIFRNQEKTTSEEKTYFPQKITLITEIKNLNNPNIRNYLNILWPKWKTYYEIELKILKQKLKTKNIISFKLKEHFKQRFLRKKFNYEILNKLNINKINLKVSQAIIDELLLIIQNQKYYWTDLLAFLKEKFQSKNNKIIVEKIRNSTWSFEWNDFLPEHF